MESAAAVVVVAGSAIHKPMSESVTAYIGLGSNLDEPRQQLEVAFERLEALPDTRVAARSRLYGSRAMGPPQPDYVNAVAAVYTRLAPLALLDGMQAIEQQHQRRRDQRWGPRTLDLDLLLYAEQTLQTPRLTLPHPGVTERNFVLVPLLEIAPALRLPDGRVVADLVEQVGSDGLWLLA